MCVARLVAVFCFLLAGTACTGKLFGGGSKARPQPVPAPILAVGQGELAKLEELAEKEGGFFDVVFGTACYTRAVQELRRDCSDLDSDASQWLAFHLTNCFFAKHNRRTYRCAAAAPSAAIATCTRQLSDDDFNIYTQFVQNVNGVCLFIANADFNRRAEAMLSNLYQSGDAATSKLEDIRSSLDTQAVGVQRMQDGLDTLSSEQSRMLESLRGSAAVLSDLHNSSLALQHGMAASERAHAQLLAAEGALEARLLALQANHSTHAARASAAWQAAELQAGRVRAWQAEQAAAQEQLSNATAAMAQASHGVEAAVSALAATQQRSERALSTLLGAAYTWADAAFYAAGLGAALALGLPDSTRAARLPVGVVFMGCLGAERGLLAYITWLPDEGGALRMMLPAPLPLFLAAPSRAALQLALRSIAVVAALLATVRVLAAYQSPSRVAEALSQHTCAHLAYINARLDHLCLALMHANATAQSPGDGVVAAGNAEVAAAVPTPPAQPPTPPLSVHPALHTAEAHWNWGHDGAPMPRAVESRGRAWPWSAQPAGIAAYRLPQRGAAPRALPPAGHWARNAPPHGYHTPTMMPALVQAAVRSGPAPLATTQPATAQRVAHQGSQCGNADSSPQPSERSARRTRRRGDPGDGSESGAAGRGGTTPRQAARGGRKRAAPGSAAADASGGHKSRRRS